MERSQSGGNTAPDPWSGWSAQAHPGAPAGGGGPGKFKTAGSLGTGNAFGAWRGTPHHLAPAARYLAVGEAYCDRGVFPQSRVVQEDGVYFVSLPARGEMRPFMRTANERFENTVKRVAARSNLAVVVNGNMYRDDAWLALPRHLLANMGGNIATQKAELTKPEGKVRGQGRDLGGDTQEQLFYMAWVEGPLGGYSFGMGNPPGDTTSALGGVGPVIIGGLRYGAQNKYRKGVPDGAPAIGEPDYRYKGFLEIRSNLTYQSFVSQAVSTGKVVIGFGTGELPLKIVVQPHGIQGITLDEIRDRLFRDGVRNAVFLDGSDSAMLFANGQFLVQAGTYKDRTNTVGIGFRLPVCYIDPAGRSLGNIA